MLLNQMVKKMMNKFNKLYESIKDTIDDAMVDIAYYIVDPAKTYASALDGNIYVNRNTAETAAKKLNAKIDVWPGLHRGGHTKYGIPKKYKIITESENE